MVPDILLAQHLSFVKYRLVLFLFRKLLYISTHWTFFDNDVDSQLRQTIFVQCKDDYAAVKYVMTRICDPIGLRATLWGNISGLIYISVNGRMDNYDFCAVNYALWFILARKYLISKAAANAFDATLP